MENTKMQETTGFGVPLTEENLDQNTALNILVNAVHVGQNRGAWKLEETPILLKAIQAFMKKEDSK
jgi:hypothetical protein